MTESYKKGLLDYLTNTIEASAPNAPYFRETSFDENYNIITTLKEMIEEQESITLRENTSPIVICTRVNPVTSIPCIFGVYQNSVDVVEQGAPVSYYGFIALLDENYRIKKVITRYDSGTKLRPIDTVQFDDDGQCYMVDSIGYTNGYGYGSPGARFCMLNNFTAEDTSGNYVLKLRRSYNFPTEQLNALQFSENSLKKVPGENKYYFVYSIIPSGSSTKIGLTTLSVNVGSSNDWDHYTANVGVYRFDYITEASGNAYIFASASNDDYIYKVVFDGDSLSSTTVLTTATVVQIEVESNNSFYAVVGDDVGGTAYTRIKYYNNGTTTTIKEVGTGTINLPSTIIRLYDGYLFSYMLVAPNGIIDEDRTAYFGFWDGNQYYEEEVATTSLRGNMTKILVITNVGNLYNIMGYRPWLSTTKMVIYSDYSGQLYNAWNELVPAHVELYSNNKIVYADELYNKVINKNTTTSTVSVGNYFLNDVSITPSVLLGKTQMQLVNSANAITKNIYEVIHINFINTLNVIDQNFGNNIINTNASNYVNANVNTNTNVLSNQAITKYRINYQDGTNLVGSLTFTRTDNTHGQFTFSAYVEKALESIELISNDETMVYQTLSAENFEMDKQYNINQYIKIE